MTTISEKYFLSTPVEVEEKKVTIDNETQPNGALRAIADESTNGFPAIIDSQVVWEKYGAFYDSPQLFYDALNNNEFGPVQINKFDFKTKKR